MRHRMGNPRDPIGLRGALADSLLIWLIGAMALLAGLTLAGHDAATNLARRWQEGASAAITVQIPNPDAARMDAALALLRSLPAVADAQVVDPARMAELLRPWLGDANGLPLPGVIELRLADAAADPVLIGDRLAEVVPGAVTEAHGAFVAGFTALARALRGVTSALLLLVCGVAAAVVVLAVRAGIAARRDSVLVLHMLGATDQDIAGRFARRVAWLALLGGIVGTAAAAPAIWLLTRLAGPLLPAMGWEALPWQGLVCLPPVAALLAWLAAQGSIRLWLRRLP